VHVLTVPPKFSCWNFSLVSQPPNPLLSPPGRAISFRELRASCWGDSPELPADIYSVRALVQRLRAKLQVADAHLTVEAIRGFGFRAVLSSVGRGSESRRRTKVGLISRP
jgi:hypothetical protein